MTYGIARRLLVSGDVEYIRRAAWFFRDEDAALTWCGDEQSGRGYIQFVSCNTTLYEFGPWQGRAEDLDAEDWEIEDWEIIGPSSE